LISDTHSSHKAFFNENSQKFKLVASALGEATNQQAEIHAAILALKQLKVPCKVRIFTDSKYLVETMKGNFSRRANLDLWNELEKIASRHKVEWEWIKGHTQKTSRKDLDLPKEFYELQAIADRVANRVAEKQDFPVDLKNRSEEKVKEILGLSREVSGKFQDSTLNEK